MKLLIAVLISALALSGAWAAQPKPKKKKPAPAAAAAAPRAPRVCKKCKRAVELFRYGFCQLCDPPIGYPKQKEQPKPVAVDPRTSGTAR